MTNFWTDALKQLREGFWEPGSLQNRPFWQRFLIPPLRTIYAIWRDWSSGELTLRAMSLVYTTLLSLVPLLAVSFSVLKAFGVHNQVEPLLQKALEPMGNQGVVITEKILGFVDNMKVGVLGLVGMVMLFYTVVALMQKIEAAFNYTWHVSQHRSFGQRFSYYLTTIMIGPVLVFSAIGLSATLMDSAPVQELLTVEPLGTLVTLAARFIPLMMIISAFTFLYILIPNTEVNFRSALIGATVAGILWQSAGMLFTLLVVSSTKHFAIYSALASLILFMFWLYIGWMILLVGASVAHYHQNPQRLLSKTRNILLSLRQQRLATLAILAQIQRHFSKGIKGPGAEEMAAELNLPGEALSPVIDKLNSAKLIFIHDEDGGWKPVQDFHSINIDEILERLDSVGENKNLSIEKWQLPEQILQWESDYQKNLQKTFSKSSLAENSHKKD